MKREIVPVNVDGMEFKILEFTWKDSLKLEKETLTILAPILDIAGNMTGGKDENGKTKEVESFLDIQIVGLGQIIQKALLSLEDPFEYIKKMVKCTYYPKQNKTGVQDTFIETDEDLDYCFRGKTLTAIKLCMEVMKVNKFSFIEGLGGLGNVTGMLNRMIGNKNNEEDVLEISEN